MGDLHDMTDYAFAKDIHKEFPPIIKELDKVLKLLYANSSYMACQHTIQAIVESQEMMEQQLRLTASILEKKGKE